MTLDYEPISQWSADGERGVSDIAEVLRVPSASQLREQELRLFAASRRAEKELFEENQRLRAELRDLRLMRTAVYDIVIAIDDALWVTDNDTGAAYCISCHVQQDTVGGHDPECPIDRAVMKATDELLMKQQHEGNENARA